MLIVPISALIGWWIYWYKNDYPDWAMSLRAAVSAARFGVLLIIGLMLLEPFLISMLNDVEKPKLLLYQDVSDSMDSTSSKTLVNLNEKFGNQLDEKYDVRVHQFGKSVFEASNETADDRLFTNYASVVEAVNSDYVNQNIGAVVVSSDGVQTYGTDPRYVSYNSTAPFITVAEGDTVLKPDYEVSEVLANELAFLNNTLQVKARISANVLDGKSTEVQLLQDGEVLAAQTFEVKTSSMVKELTFNVEATRIGLNKFTVRVVADPAEENLLNNSLEAFVDVLDNRTQVLILAKNPHPDIAAFKAAIETVDQYEVEVQLLEDWDEKYENVDLAILHALPTGSGDLNKLKVFRDNKIPVFSILTPSVSLLHYKQLDLGLNLASVRKKTDKAGTYLNDGFNLFKSTPNDELARYPPMSVLFGDYSLSSDGQLLLKQRIGPVETDKPLLGYTSADGWKRAFLLGDGWWRWRLYERMRLDKSWTDDVLVKTVQYLALKQKKTRLRITAPNKVNEGVAVRFEGEYYNESFELVNDENLELKLSDSLDRTFDFKFKPTGSGYELSLGALDPGDYQWEARIQSKGQTFTEKGEFIVVQNKAEFFQLRADHRFLKDWTMAYDGTHFPTNNIESLATHLLNLDTAKPLIHTTKEWNSIIEWKWLAILIILLISIEWFLRKFNGYY